MLNRNRYSSKPAVDFLIRTADGHRLNPPLITNPLRAVRLAPLLLILLLRPAIAALPERRFDGVWVGTETIERPFKPRPVVVKKRPAKIIIVEGGTLLAIAEGHCPGRYANVNRSGETLNVSAGDCKLQLILSRREDINRNWRLDGCDSHDGNSAPRPRATQRNPSSANRRHVS